LPVAEKSQSMRSRAMKSSKPARLSAARASSRSVVRRDTLVRQAARKRSPQAHCQGSKRRRRESGESGESSSLGSCSQSEGSASGCT
jgi:hypothetical protein